MPKHRCPEFENHERWLLSFADMLTLLFAVFVVLFALKETGENSEDAAGSLEESFNKPLEDIPPSQSGGASDSDFGIFDHLRGTKPTPPLVNKYLDVVQSVKVVDDDMNLVSRQIEERLYGSQIHRQTKSKGSSRVISIERTNTGFKIKLLARHFYGPGKLHMKKSALKSLDHVIQVIKKLDREVRIEGHSDGMTRKRSHWDESVLRAANIVKYMVEKHQFPPSLLSAAGFGDTKPMASNSTEAGRAMNRRIEISVRYSEDMGLEQK